MDYVVFGIGMGASLVLLGLAGRAIGPMLRYRRSRSSGEILAAVELLAQVAWARFCNALGAAIAFGGTLLLIVTGINMALRIDDGAAAVIVGLTLLLIVVLMAVWTWAYIGRFGLYGIVAQRPSTSTLQAQPPYDADEWNDSEAELDMPFLSAQAAEPDTETVASTTRQDRPRNQTDAEPRPSPEKVAGPKRSFALRLNPKPANQTAQVPEHPAAAASFASARPESAQVANPIAPERQIPEPVTTSVSSPAIDVSRSEVVNPSDAAALERILSEPDEPTDVDLESFFVTDPDQ